MKRLCVCLCCVLLALTACGRPASVDTTEAFSAVSEQTTVQTQTQGEPTETESALPPGDVQTEPVTTEAQTEAAAEPTATTAVATTAPTVSTTTQKAHSTQTTRETHTLFTTPQRTTGTTTTTTTTTTKRPAATTTTKAPATTTTTRPPVTTGAPNTPVQTVRPVRNTCTVTIDCRELLEHPEKLKTPEKSAFVPKSGYIVRNVTMEFTDGESVYDVLRRVCATHTCTDNCPFCQKDGSIQMESTYTPQFDSYYVEGIHQLYEKDCGGTSGWTYWVNDRFPNYGSSDYIVKPGDRIEWIYSITLDANETF